MTSPETLLTPAEVGVILGGKSARWVIESRLKFGWPHFAAGRTILFSPEDVEEIKRRQRVQPDVADDFDALEGQTERSRRAS